MTFSDSTLPLLVLQSELLSNFRLFVCEEVFPSTAVRDLSIIAFSPNPSLGTSNATIHERSNDVRTNYFSPKSLTLQQLQHLKRGTRIHQVFDILRSTKIL